MLNPLAQSIAQFTDWRVRMIAAIDAFRAWQDTYGTAEIEQALRLYDLMEKLRNDRIRLTFLGESAAAKISLINALLFADVPDGLLPAGEGAEFLCASEFSHDPATAPYVRMLPIDTLRSAESIATLRRTPVEWVNLRFDPESPDSVTEAMRSLADSRMVTVDEAKSLNLTGIAAADDMVSIPAWRYALVNLPLSTLKSGLAVHYSPSLQMLCAEPELALPMVSGAHSLVFVIDGLTAEVREVWKQYVESSPAHKFVVLDQSSGAPAMSAQDIAQSLAALASQVHLINLKRAVTPETAGNGLDELMQAHVRLVPERQSLLLATITREIGYLVTAARQAIVTRFGAITKEMQDLADASGKSRSVAQDMLTRLETERGIYQKSVAAFEVIYARLMARGQELLSALHDDQIESILSHDREFIAGAWTTAGMWKNMQGLFTYFTEQVAKILDYAIELKKTVDGIYQDFHKNFGLAALTSPPLTLTRRREAMLTLRDSARSFCHNPVNIATYKPQMVKKFYDGLVEEARQQFELTRLDTERWLHSALGPLNAQIRERQNLMLKRVQNLRNLRDNLNSAQERLKALQAQRVTIREHAQQLEQLRSELAAPAAKESAGAGHPHARAMTL